MVKIVKKKVLVIDRQKNPIYSLEASVPSLITITFLLQSDLPVREKIFLLLDATQTSLGGASGKFPQYYAAYYDLVVGPRLLHE